MAVPRSPLTLSDYTFFLTFRWWLRFVSQSVFDSGDLFHSYCKEALRCFASGSIHQSRDSGCLGDEWACGRAAVPSRDSPQRESVEWPMIRYVSRIVYTYCIPIICYLLGALIHHILNIWLLCWVLGLLGVYYCSSVLLKIYRCVDKIVYSCTISYLFCVLYGMCMIRDALSLIRVFSVCFIESRRLWAWYWCMHAQL